MNTSTVLDFIKARWRIIVILVVVVIVVSLITIILLLFVAGIFFLPTEMTQSSEVVTWYTNNSTGII